MTFVPPLQVPKQAGRAIFPRVRGPEGVAPREQSRRWRMSAVQCAAAAGVFCVTV